MQVCSHVITPPTKSSLPKLFMQRFACLLNLKTISHLGSQQITVITVKMPRAEKA